MNMVDAILKKLPNLKSSEDFAAAVVTLETAHSEASAKVAELEAGREDRIFSGGNLSALEGDILAAESRVKTLAIAVSGATKRQAAAVEVEAEAKLVKVADEAGKLNKTLRARLIAFGVLADELAGHATVITNLRAEVLVKNTHLRTCGRADLAIDDPTAVLSELAGRRVLDPIKSLVVPEFFPHRHEDGPALLMLTK